MSSEYNEVLENEGGSIPYEMTFFDRQSLDEIKSMIDNSLYFDALMVKDHMEFLENLKLRLQNAISSETKPEAVEALKKNIMEVDHTIFNLNGMMNKAS